jgi:hypothetical protein
MYLTDATNQEIQAQAQRKGYTFNDADCEELRRESYEGETLEEVLTHYLKQFER